MFEFFPKNSDEKNNYGLFFGLYILTVLVNYYSPEVIRVTYFIGLLLAFYISKNNPIWIALFWCLIYSPGYLFNVADGKYSLPFFGLPGLGRDIAFTEILVLLIFIKSFKIKPKIKVNNSFWILIAFSAVLLVVTFMWGISGMKISRTIRFLIPYTLLWSIPKFFNMHKMRILFNYFLIFTIPIVLCQLYIIATGQHMMYFFGGSFSGRKELLNDLNYDAGSDLIRPMYSTHLLLLNVFYAFHLFLMNKQDYDRVRPKYTFLYLLLSILSLLITGSRGYALGVLGMVIIYFIIDYRKLMLNSMKLFAGVICFFCLFLIPKIGTQITLSFERLFTLQSFIEGDKTAGGTLIRVTQRMPIVMEKVNESPLLGYGYSDIFYKYADGHVANATVLLNGGILGMMIIIAFIGFLFSQSIKLAKLSDRKFVLSIIIGISGFLIVHSTSYIVFSFLFGQPNYIGFALLLCFTNVMIEETKMNLSFNSFIRDKKTDPLNTIAIEN